MRCSVPGVRQTDRSPTPILLELVTEGDTLEEAYANVSDALAAVIELYAEQGRVLPAGTELPSEMSA